MGLDCEEITGLKIRLGSKGLDQLGQRVHWKVVD